MADTVTKTYGVGGKQITVSVLRTLAAAGDYAAEDVMSDNATNGAGTAMSFTGIANHKGGSGVIIAAEILCSTTALTPSITLFLFKGTPTCELDDNAANTAVLAADQANFIGTIDMPPMEDLGTGMSQTIATMSDTGSKLPLPFVCAADDDTIYVVTVTRDAITGEAASMTFRTNLTSRCD